MKVSVSLPEEDVEFIDSYATERQLSRSAALHQAVGALRGQDLAAEYEAAHQEWIDAGEAALWEIVTADGLEGS